MLMIKKCFQECGLSQQQLVKATGWSKALISRVFSTGELPVDTAKFEADVVRFVEEWVVIGDWLRHRGLEARDLLKPEMGKVLPFSATREPDLVQCIDSMVGGAILADERDELTKAVIAFAKATKLLLVELETKGDEMMQARVASVLVGGAA